MNLCGTGGRTGRSARGFTLLELLTVMAIACILMGMSAAAYFGIIRTSSMHGAIANVKGNLILARQHAVMHRMRSYVMFWQDGTNSHYVICMQEGIHATDAPEPSAKLVIAAPRWKSGQLVGARIYNLTQEVSAGVTANGEQDITAAMPSPWRRGDRYGWAIHDVEHLPSGVKFDNSGSTDGSPQTVVFLPDGTTARKGNGDYSIKLAELRGDATAEIKVYGLSGMVEVQ
jgi:prepilin-type N-terminal cleavage/methylation domain-containing protein